MKIAICDDEAQMREEISAQLIRLQNNYDERFEIVQFDNGDDLCTHLNGLDLDLIFLDFKMSGIDGVETAKIIYDSNNKKVKIIFVTGYDDCAKYLFRLNVIDFIVKPIRYEKIKDAFEYYYSKYYQRQYPAFKFKLKKEEQSVPINTIVCFETGDDHSTIIHLNGEDEPLQFRRLFREVWDEIQQYECFVLPNRSYIINLSYARNITSDSIDIMNKTVLISRKNKQDTKDRYLVFLDKQTNEEV